MDQTYHRNMKGLVLSGGGARGAYQVGVLNALADISAGLKIKSPFKIFTGVSAGAINASFMAAGADDFSAASRKLMDLWSNLHSGNVFYTDAVSLGKIGLKWMGELSFGGISGPAGAKALLDTTPLGELIKNNLEFAKIQRNIENESLYALAITAMDYQDSTSMTFVQGHESIPLWKRTRRYSKKATIATSHIMGSSAIPMLFPPVAIDNGYFGDGCVRNLVPCSPAIHLGAQQLMIIGVRTQKETAYDQRVKTQQHPPSTARVINMLLNAVLLDGVEVDVERLKRVNDFVNQVPEVYQAQLNFKPLEYVFISPSEDLGAIAASLATRLPRIIRYLLKGLGPIEDASEVVSYLLFEKEFLSKLIECGYRDTMNARDAVEKFFLS